MRDSLPSHLPDAPWRHEAGMDVLFSALEAESGTTRFVGGAVRDALIGIAVKDVDLATTLRPNAVIDRLKQAGIKVVPTGIDHGTVTAVLAGRPVEITTLRRDVATDGRRATIAYADDWREDAARRDFTINALYADPQTGEITDYFGGRDDLAARRVRFIGDADARIAEDHLRILRYFRFLARFGTGDIAVLDLQACAHHAASLRSLSRERVADEVMKLLAVGDPLPALRLMLENGVLAHVLPEVSSDGLERLALLSITEQTLRVAVDPVRRLIALIGVDLRTADGVAARLRLSNRLRKHLAAVLTPVDAASPQGLAYTIGPSAARDQMLLRLAFSPEDIAHLDGWIVPRFPISGGALIARGLTAGPDVARVLRDIEAAWIAEGFPDETRVAALADQCVGALLRSRQ